MFENKGTIVISFDDIIAYNTYDLYKYLCNDFSFYSKYLNIYELRNKEDIYNRNKYDLIDYLLKDEVANGTDEYKLDSLSILYTALHKYYSISDSYNPLITTKLAKGLVNPLFANNGGIQSIVVLVKYKTDIEKNRKIKFVNNLFKNNVKVKILTFHYMKDDYITVVNNLPWDLLITDDIDLIEKTAAGDIDHKEYLVPEYGYATVKPELIELIKLKSATLSCYKPE